MTPTQKLKWAVVAKNAEWRGRQLPEYPCPNIDELYSELVDSDENWDAEEEIRAGTVDTGLDCEWSSHYESKSVAMQMPDGSWVGWVYWYGGGKHGDPGSIDWMEDAYEIECREEEKLVVVRTFLKLPSQSLAT